MNLTNRVIIVTGASAGIGRATAVLLAGRGANVVITARRAERLEGLVDELAAHPGRRLAVPGDIGDEAFAAQLVARTVAEFGRIDGLVNNAGVGYKGTLREMPPEAMRRLLDTNLLGVLYLTQQAAPHMPRGGRIVNVSSIVSQRPLPDAALYAASKAALDMLSRSLRAELRPYGIGVTIVYPGLTATEFADARLGQTGGNRFGLRGVSAERVGRKVIAALENGRSNVFIAWHDWLFWHLNRLIPGAADWLTWLLTRWS